MLYKTLPLETVSLKMSSDAHGTFSGYASVFGGVDSYGDTIEPGAFSATLQKHGSPKMFFNHDSYAVPIGKYSVVKEDAKGLYVEGQLTLDVSLAKDVHAALKAGTVDGLSIGGYLAKNDYKEWEDDTGLRRSIHTWSRLVEISPVTFPADKAARIGFETVKNEEISALETIKDFERFLRDAGGFSKGMSTALASRARLIFSQGDPAPKEPEAKAIEKIVQRIHEASLRFSN